jgi:CBS domain-containing protein
VRAAAPPGVAKGPAIGHGGHMPIVRDLLDRKGTTVVSVPPDTSVLDAATLMNDRGIGAVLVLDGNEPAGIFTERDVLRRVVAAQRDPATTMVGEVMTTRLISCSPDTPLSECASMMSTRRIRHLPVVGASGLAGLVTSGDLLAFQLDDQAATIQHLNSYLYDVR